MSNRRPTHNQLSSVLDLAEDFFNEHARALADMAANDADTPSAVLQSCSEAIEQLGELLETSGNDDPELQEDVQQASDDIVLMSLEDSADSAVDAVTLLLQLRRDVLLKRAA